MSVHVDEENIFPSPSLQGSGFDLGEIDLGSRNGSQETVENSHLFRCRKNDRSFIVSGSPALLTADHHKAGVVVGVILDVFRENAQAVMGGRIFRGDSRSGFIMTGHLGGLGSA